MTGPDLHRLPRTVLPRRYELEIAPDLDEATFAGHVRIDAEVTTATAEVVLNSLELEIDEAWVEVDDARHDASVRLDPDTERLFLTVSDALAPGPVTVGCRFRGVLNDKLVGFYRSTFTDADGNEQIVATSQMEATYARQAFPCWDEPDLKATFAISLVVADGLTALSNGGEVARDVLGDGRTRVRFVETMPMSTYLVAFVVGPLELTDPVDVRGVPLRIAHVPGKADLTAFALEVGAFALEFLADYYDIAYPADKLDLVAIPDFAFGAMENLGCVTFRETYLLVDPDTAAHGDLVNVVDVIAHEIAHMWFGDLVTMKWWNGIWLNEAFATFMELKTTDAFRPAWDRWNHFGASRSAAYDTDALSTTRPIEFTVVSPAEAEAMFDVLTYEKGAAVVRMLEQYLGEDRFRHGVGLYLRRHLHGNTETTDLWDAIEEATGEPVRRIMDSWIFQAGFPVLDVAVDDDGVVLRQAPFRYDAGPRDAEGADAEWLVPAVVTVETDGAATVEKVLVDGAPCRVTAGARPTLVKANTGATGYYRVRLPADLLDAAAARALESFSPLERLALVDDTWAGVVAGTTAAEQFVLVAERLRSEDDPAVWKRVLAGLGTIDRIVADEARPAFRRRAHEIVAPRRAALGLEPSPSEADTTRDLRADLFRFAGIVLDEAETAAAATALVERAFAGEEVDASLAAAAVSVYGHHADAVAYDRLIDRFHTAPTPQEQVRVLYALAGLADPDLAARFVSYALESGEVRTQNMPFVLARAISQRANGAQTWRLVRDGWPALMDKLASSTVPRLVEGVRAITDPSLAADVSAFLAEHPVQNERAIAQHLERMQVSVAMAEREAGAFMAGPS